MKINRNTSIVGKNIILVPYKKEHVERYNQWMQSAELQELTASEPLTLEQEYDMQVSWLEDEHKCTFIILDAFKYAASKDEIGSMGGDVNLFFNDDDDPHSAEMEIMIAEKECRGKGLGGEAVYAMMKYGISVLNVTTFTAKIGLSNKASIDMFTKKFGFTEVSRSDIFQEVTLALPVTEEIKQTVYNSAQHMNILSSSQTP